MQRTESQTITPETQAAQQYAKSTYVQGTTARVISTLNGGKAVLKNLDSLIRNDAVRASSRIGSQLNTLHSHIPPIVTGITNTVNEIQQQLGFLTAAKSKLAPLLTDQANQLFAENTALQTKATKLETAATALVKSIDELHKQVALGNITPQKMLDELKKINSNIKPIQDGVEKLEDDLEVKHRELMKFQNQILLENNAAKVASLLQPTPQR